VRLAIVPRFSASRFWEQVSRTRATHIHYLGGIAQILLRSPETEAEKQHGARIAWGAGLPQSERGPFERRFGVRVVECYGMTEASSFTTCNLEAVPGSVGKVVPWLEFRISGADGKTVKVGEQGEIVVRECIDGALFGGYYRNPEATARALRDGELWTGDLGRVDEAGNLYFVGRATDSLRIRGENVSAWEIEHVVKGHPAVEDAAVVAVPAEVGEQEAKLFVKVRPGRPLTLPELHAWLGPRLGKHQRPRYLTFVESFHYTPSQRVVKHVLPKDVGDCYDASHRATAAEGNQA
jgi:crotonobetaine/carnitine-CoA ligase